MDAHSDFQTKQSVEDDYSGFLIKISPQGEVPLVNHGSFLLRPGNQNYIGISALSTVSKGIADIHPKDKGCFYEHEMDLLAHKNYTQANCLLECQILWATKQLNCHPWFFPSLEKGIKMCDPWNARDFKEQFGKVPTETCEYCLPGCDSTLYTVSLSTAPFRLNPKYYKYKS